MSAAKHSGMKHEKKLKQIQEKYSSHPNTLDHNTFYEYIKDMCSNQPSGETYQLQILFRRLPLNNEFGE